MASKILGGGGAG